MTTKFEWNEGEYRVFVSQAGEIGKLVRKIGEDVRAEAVLLCSNRMVNVRTGRLRSSIEARFESGGDGPMSTIGSAVEYAPYVHEKRPFLTTALQTVLARL